MPPRDAVIDQQGLGEAVLEKAALQRPAHRRARRPPQRLQGHREATVIVEELNGKPSHGATDTAP